MDQEFLTIQEVAKLLRISESTVRSYIRNGQLPCLKLGAGRSAAVRVRRIDIDELVRYKPQRGNDESNESKEE